MSAFTPDCVGVSPKGQDPNAGLEYWNVFTIFVCSRYRERSNLVNMIEADIIGRALENLEKGTRITGRWTPKGPRGLDGQLTLILDKERIKFNAEVKFEPRSVQLPQILEYNQRFEPFILVAGHLFPKMKEALQRHNIAYLEANGNFFLKSDQKWFLINTNPSVPLRKNYRNRAFTKTGLRVVFEFLLDETLINQPYRHIAARAQTAIGNVANIIKGLRKEGFVLQLNDEEIRLTRKNELLKKWAAAYDENLKPGLKVGTFRFLKEEQYTTWQKMNVNQDKTWWGGEPAGDLLTNYLRPAHFTLYTTETRAELMKNYRLVPDEKGRIHVFRKFWNQPSEKVRTVPPVLVYADLVNTGDPRCLETAQKVYEQYLKDEFEPPA